MQSKRVVNRMGTIQVKGVKDNNIALLWDNWHKLNFRRQSLIRIFLDSTCLLSKSAKFIIYIRKAIIKKHRLKIVVTDSLQFSLSTHSTYRNVPS